MKSSKAILLAGVAASVAIATSAIAQQPLGPTAQGYFDRDRNTSVTQRVDPSLDPIGIPAGSFRLYPELYVAAGYTDNAFTTDTGEVDSTVGIVEASANLISDWGLHALNLFGSVNSNTLFEAGAADTYTYNVGADGRLDLSSNTVVFSGASYTNGREALADNPSVSIISPVEYELIQSNLGYQAALNRLRLQTELLFTSADYQDSTLFTGTPSDQDYRDQTTLAARVRGDVALTYDTSLFIQGTASGVDYQDGGPGGPEKDAEGYELLLGADFDLSNLSRGQVGFGYFSRSFDSAFYDDVEGFAANVGLDYFVTPLVTVYVNARRGVSESALANTSSTIDSSLLVGADYEFRPNIILHGAASYNIYDFQGIDREDNRWSVEGGADYKFNRWLSLTASASYTNNESNGTAIGRDFEALEASIGVRLAR